MVGKGALLVVFGFIMAFAIFQVKMSSNVLATSDNFSSNYMETLIHETALTAMNLAVNKVWNTSVNNDTFSFRANHCSARVEISKPGLDTVKVKVKAWGNAYDKIHQQFMTRADSISAYFSYNMPISEYFWFTNNEGTVYWITGDTIWGPLHTNSKILTSGSPVFYGKVTAFKGIDPSPLKKSNKAKFYGGWEVGIKNTIPTDMTYLKDAANTGNAGAPKNEKCIYDKNVTFDFQADGSVIRTVQGSPTDTVKIKDIAPTGAIYSSKDVRVKGVFNGALTIYSEDDVYIDDDLVYADNPLTNPNSNDILGLVAKDDIWVTDNYANRHDCNIQACVMAMNGSFGAENYASRPVSGVLSMTGSIVQNDRGPVGTFYGSGTIASGFSKRYRFDPRLSSLSPPNYPFLKSLHLVAWWE